MKTITEIQKKQLERIWFIYGNYGKKHNDANHKIIQGLLRGDDYRNTNMNNYASEECKKEIKKILKQD